MCSTLVGEELEPEGKPIHEVIDHYVNAALQEANSVAAPQADDATVLRRTMLDLVGRTPTASEARAYTSDVDPDKRRKLVESLLHAPAYARHQANEFDAMLMLGSNANLREYLVEAIGENRPWDAMFREMMLGVVEDVEQKGPLQYIRARSNDIDKLTVRASVDFFGVNISCAKCHDHPEAPEWTQDRFYGMKSFFARTFDNGGLVGEREYGQVQYKTTSGETIDAKLMFFTGHVVEEGEAKEPTDEEKKAEKNRLEQLKKDKKAPPPAKNSRRQKLVDIARDDAAAREYFSRAIVNRIWARLLGRGLVTPVDQMHPENPPSHPELLGWLARDLQAHQYDLRRLIQGIVLSDVYARSSLWSSESERPDPALFAIGAVRPLTPSQYASALKIAATDPNYFAADVAAEELAKRIEQTENAARGFAGLIEYPGEDFQIGVTEALLFANGDRFQREFLAEGNTLVSAIKKLENDDQLVETLIWSVFGRAPHDEETTALKAYLEAESSRRDQACANLVWAMLTSAELRFNH